MKLFEEFINELSKSTYRNAAGAAQRLGQDRASDFLDAAGDKRYKKRKFAEETNRYKEDSEAKFYNEHKVDINKLNGMVRDEIAGTYGDMIINAAQDTSFGGQKRSQAKYGVVLKPTDHGETIKRYAYGNYIDLLSKCMIGVARVDTEKFDQQATIAYDVEEKCVDIQYQTVRTFKDATIQNQNEIDEVVDDLFSKTPEASEAIKTICRMILDYFAK